VESFDATIEEAAVWLQRTTRDCGSVPPREVPDERTQHHLGPAFVRPSTQEVITPRFGRRR
jgi:hypothetical protein